MPLRSQNHDNRSLVREVRSLENKAPLACAPPKCPQKKKEPNRALAAKKIDINKSMKTGKVAENNQSKTQAVHIEIKKQMTQSK